MALTLAGLAPSGSVPFRSRRWREEGERGHNRVIHSRENLHHLGRAGLWAVNLQGAHGLAGKMGLASLPFWWWGKETSASEILFVLFCLEFTIPAPQSGN